jgi:cyclase
MLKKRVVATVVVKDGIVVQSINFKKYLPVGKPPIALEFLNQWGIDEIILIDISASKKNKEPNYSVVEKASEKCFVPLTVGGGISKIEHIQRLMQCGADKISLNTSAIYQPELITSAAHIFGDQCVVVSIDAIITSSGYRVYDYVNKKTLEISPAEFAKEAVKLGAGEILINSVDRDGSYLGYDHELINSICAQVKVPVICSGGAKNADDFIKVFQETNVSAASAANFFHFFEHSVNITKCGIKKKADVRLETHADYSESKFDLNFRLQKKSDQELEEMLFIRIEKEII